MVRRAYDNGDIYLGTYEGWYCPNEGFKATSDLLETAHGMQCPNHPDVPAPVALGAQLVLPPVGLPGPPARATTRSTRTSCSRTTGATRCWASSARASRTSRSAAAGATWGIPFPIARERRDAPQREDGSWDPEAGTIYVWYDALINYITGAGFPDDLEAFHKWWPADLHVIGKDIARFHTIYWPAMLWSAGLEPPRQVWVHGWLLVPGGERMSKSRGNFLDPVDVVDAFGADGARYVTLREVAFDRDTEVSWDSFVRRYNADLANDFGNLVNRTVSMVNRYLDGERPAPRPPPGRRSARAGPRRSRLYTGSARRLPAPRRPGRAVGVRRRREPERRRRAAVDAQQGRRRPATRRRRRRLRDVLGDLVEACRLVGLAVAPFMPGAAPRILDQLGHAYPYAADGNGGPDVRELLAWGALAAEPGRVTDTPLPLFPRMDAEAVETPGA